MTDEKREHRVPDLKMDPESVADWKRERWAVWVDCYRPDIDDSPETFPGIAFSSVETRDAAMRDLDLTTAYKNRRAEQEREIRHARIIITAITSSQGGTLRVPANALASAETTTLTSQTAEDGSILLSLSAIGDDQNV